MKKSDIFKGQVCSNPPSRSTATKERKNHLQITCRRISITAVKPPKSKELPQRSILFILHTLNHSTHPNMYSL